MSPHRDQMVNFCKFDSPNYIVIGNGDHLLAFGEGTIPFTSGNFEGELSNVLWAPKLTENLFSVTRAMERGCSLEFDHEQSIVSFFRYGELVLLGRKKPKSTFIIEGHANYKVGNITHTGGFHDTSISRQLKRKKKSHVPGLHVLGESSPTPTPQEMTTKSETATSQAKLQPNIVATLTNLTTKMNKTITNIKAAFKNLPTLNTTKITEDFTAMDALDFLTEGLATIGEYFKNIGAHMSIFGIGLVVILIMPVIEIALLGFKLIKLPVGLWLGSARRVKAKLADATKYELPLTNW